MVNRNAGHPASGRKNVHLILLEFPDRQGDHHGVHVGVSRYAPAQRFDQHNAGVCATGYMPKRSWQARCVTQGFASRAVTEAGGTTP
jgi:hypothetical protein